MNHLRIGTDLPHQRGVTALHWTLAAAWWCLCAGLQLARWVICALLVLGEPIVRAVLVPVAFLSFLVTLIFGFLIGDARFPRWGMLAFSVGALMLYWLYLGLMSLFMTLPSHDQDR
jgi:hypothetical protein